MLPILAATAAAFVLGGAYYAVFGNRLESSSEMPPWKLAVELARCLTLAAVVAALAWRADVDELAGGLALGLVLWVGFPLVLWTGALIHERTPFTVAAIHGGDWLVKLLVVGAIVSVWQ